MTTDLKTHRAQEALHAAILALRVHETEPLTQHTFIMGIISFALQTEDKSLQNEAEKLLREILNHDGIDIRGWPIPFSAITIASAADVGRWRCTRCLTHGERQLLVEATIEDLLPPRVASKFASRLKKEGIHNLSDLTQYSIADLLRIPNIGQTAVDEIVNAMREKWGLRPSNTTSTVAAFVSCDASALSFLNSFGIDTNDYDFAKRGVQLLLNKTQLEQLQRFPADFSVKLTASRMPSVPWHSVRVPCTSPTGMAVEP